MASLPGVESGLTGFKDVQDKVNQENQGNPENPDSDKIQKQNLEQTKPQPAPIAEQEKPDSNIRFALISGDKTSSTAAVLEHDAVKVISNRLFNRLGLHKSGKLSLIIHDAESSLPEPIKKQIERDNAQGSVRGVYYKGAVHIVASNVRNEKEIEEVLFHEASGHYGVRTLFGQDTQRALTRLFIKLGKEEGIRAIAEQQGINLDKYFEIAQTLDPVHRAVMLTDELLAHLQGAKVYQTLLQKTKTALHEFWGAIRAALRRAGFKKLSTLTDTDLAYLLQRMTKSARTGEKTGSFVSEKNDIRYSSKPDNTDTLQIFQNLDSRTPQATREKALAEVLNNPNHDRIMYIENNFVEFLSQLAGLEGFEIRC